MLIPQSYLYEGGYLIITVWALTFRCREAWYSKAITGICKQVHEACEEAFHDNGGCHEKSCASSRREEKGLKACL